MSGKGFGGKKGAFGWGKGSNWGNNSWSGGWNDAPRTWTDKKWDEEAAPENNKTTRIVNKFQLTHEVVRPSCNSDGSAFVKKTQKMSDDKFLSEENMVAMMTPNNSHLLRRPGTGLSEVSASLCSAIEMLTHLKEDPSGPGLQDLQALLTESDDFVTALGVLNKDNDMERDDDEVRKAILIVEGFVQERKDVLLHLLMKACCFANRVYVGTFSALQLCTALQNPQWWSTQIPDKLTTSKTVQRWKADGDDKQKMVKALAKIYTDNIDEEKSYAGSSNRPAALFGPSQKRKKKGFIFFRRHGRKEVEKEADRQEEENIDNFFIRREDEKEEEEQEDRRVFVRIAGRVPKSKKKKDTEKVVQEACINIIV